LHFGGILYAHEKHKAKLAKHRARKGNQPGALLVRPPAHLAGPALYRLLLPRWKATQKNRPRRTAVRDNRRPRPPCDMPRSERCHIRGNCLHGITLPSLAQVPVAGRAPGDGRALPPFADFNWEVAYATRAFKRAIDVAEAERTSAATQ
jgi:hypothetical protein